MIPGGNLQERLSRRATITAYCLTGRTTSGPRTREIRDRLGYAPIALSRRLAQDLGLKRGRGKFDYRFGCIIEVDGIGKFVFADLMPTRWIGYRVDIWIDPRHYKGFTPRKSQVRVVDLIRK